VMRWAKEWVKEGVELDPKKLLPAEGPRPFLPRRWAVEGNLLVVGPEQEDEQRLREAA
jgi:hypothetical protein